MKILEHRRHSERQDRSDNMSHLSQKGIDLAHSISNLLDKYNLVITSPLPRAVETAVAFGFAVDATEKLLSTYGGKIHSIAEYPFNFSEISSYLIEFQDFSRFAAIQVELYKNYLNKVPKNGAVLFVSHGGIIDIPLVHLFPQATHSSWGEIFGYCEGYRLYFNEEYDEFERYELLRQ